MSAYSRIGLTNEKYMVCNDFLSNWNFKVCNMLSRFQAFDVISEICSCQVQLLLNTSPKCLWNSTLFTSTVFIETVGWFICTFFLEIISSSVLCGLNFTSHAFAHWWILSRSKSIRSAVMTGSSTIRYKEVSSANNFTLEPMSFTISSMNKRNKRGPIIDPWGTPAFICLKSEKEPSNTTLWWRWSK